MVEPRHGGAVGKMPRYFDVILLEPLGKEVASPMTQSIRAVMAFADASLPIASKGRQRSTPMTRWPARAAGFAWRPWPHPTSRIADLGGRVATNSRTSGHGRVREAAYEDAIRSYVSRMDAFDRSIEQKSRRREIKTLSQDSSGIRCVSCNVRSRISERVGSDAVVRPRSRYRTYVGAIFEPQTGHVFAATSYVPSFGHRCRSFRPPNLPRFAAGVPSTSTMSIAKSIVGALLRLVPTPNPSTPASSKAGIDFSSTRPETKILTSL